MKVLLPMERWFAKDGLTVIEFPVHVDYEVLYKILESLQESSTVLIHSKPVEYDLWRSVFSIDGTLHTTTVESRLRHRVAEKSILRLSPFSTQSFMVSLKKQSEEVSRQLDSPIWWLWWTPSDLAIQKVADDTIVECVGAIGSEYSDSNFIIFVAKEAHSERGLALLELAPRILIDVEYDLGENNFVWTVVRHPDRNLRGDRFEYKM